MVSDPDQRDGLDGDSENILGLAGCCIRVFQSFSISHTVAHFKSIELLTIFISFMQN